MKFEIISEVLVPSLGKVKSTHIQTFADDSNVFGRVFEYHQYMYNTFPNCEFKLIKATEI